MSHYTDLIDRYQEMPPKELAETIDNLETRLVIIEDHAARVQSYIAAARKAQKNQRKANGKQADRAKA